ncbi:hypothetical protein EQM14_02555 [Caproiciproducens sp. NJN-50]|uniref:mannonate dehydratase n=1 Tax=Acutalibacteraceae TaxID=3082771 RepID=UPI000FFE3029|nr:MULTISPECIES: mannonate dehydratase [Acutalibacteraceae]QAT48741.1 hypothetical protein EQM14_02555 [Caproiciproducens sp. NJN-50]
MKKGTHIKVQHIVWSDASDDELLFLKQLGLKYVYAYFKDEHCNYNDMMRFQERLSSYGLSITDAGNLSIYKCPSIHLGLPDRDECIDRYIEFTRNLGKLGIRVGYMSWDPDKIFTSRYAVGKYSRGCVTRIVDEKDIPKTVNLFGRVYTEEDIWDNCAYFLKRVLPELEKADVRLAFHPNDPPIPSINGVHNLLWRSQEYRRLFELAENSPYIGMKLCTGCWLETGAQFGNLLQDLREFVSQGKVFVVHFRNVSGTLPYFEETMIEDGYTDLRPVMEELVKLDYTGTVSIDHPLSFVPSCGGEKSGVAYMLGYLKSMLSSAQKEVNGPMEKNKANQ